MLSINIISIYINFKKVVTTFAYTFTYINLISKNIDLLLYINQVVKKINLVKNMLHKLRDC